MKNTVENFRGEEDALPNLNMGDIMVVDDGDLGFSLVDRRTKKYIIFINAIGSLSLMQWLQQKKHPDFACEKLA